MGPSTVLMSVDHAAGASTEKRSLTSWFAGKFEAMRREAADRSLREQLAAMDDTMLRDIGIADDELHMIRARNRFTPRAWASKGSRWEV